MRMPSFLQRFSWRTIAAILLSAIVALWAVVTAARRAKAEAANATVEICLDWDEVNRLCNENSYPLINFLDRCKAIGVSSIVVNEETLASLTASGNVIFFSYADYMRFRMLDMIAPGTTLTGNTLMTADTGLADYLRHELEIRYAITVTDVKSGKYRVLAPSSPLSPVAPLVNSPWDMSMPLGFPPQKAAFAAEHGFDIILRFNNSGNPAWFSPLLPKNVSGALFDVKEVPGYPGNEYITAKKLKENGLKSVFMEFTSVPGGTALIGLSPQQVVRGHTIPPAELNRSQDTGPAIARFMRATKERSIRFIYFRFHYQKSIEDNLAFLRNLAQELKKNNLQLGKASPPGFPVRGYPVLWSYFAMAVTVIFPLLALYNGRQFKRPLAAYVAVNSISIAGGILISALLYDFYFIQKITALPSVKGVMLLPLLLAVFILYSPLQLKKAWSSSISVRSLTAIAAGAIMLGILVIRSGNEAPSWLQPEQGLRQFMENILAVRPRTKEFLFAQPLLLLGFYLNRPLLLWLGLIGQVSIMNTFLHAHTPFLISLVRTFHGIWIGLFIGFGLFLIIRFFRRTAGTAPLPGGEKEP